MRKCRVYVQSPQCRIFSHHKHNLLHGDDNSDGDGDVVSCCDKIIDAAKVMTPCECESPGFCQRHNYEKVPHFHNLCRTYIAYFDQYERGEGPGQKIGEPARFIFGLGDVVAWFTWHVLRMRPLATCGCHARRAWLNKWFPIWPIRWPGGGR
jgi:hypothetical protein